MLRRGALLRAHDTLLERRANLCKDLAGELAHLPDFAAAAFAADSSPPALTTCGGKMSSQMAELDAGERSP